MPENPALEDDYDLVIIGSGGGAIPAALVAKQLGKRAVILEKLDRVGGSTSFSGGVWWIPNNSLLAEAGIADSYEQSREYFDSCVTYAGQGVTAKRRDAFLKAGPRMIDFLRGLGLKVRRPRDPWPDYYDDRPGGLPAGRSLLVEPFNLRELGPWLDHLAQYEPMQLPMGAEEFPTLFLMKRTLAGKLKAVRFGLLMARDKIMRRRTVANGAAMQGRLLQIALREAINLQRNTPVKDLLVEAGRVVGVVVEQHGRERPIRARAGVIANVGGFARNATFRQRVSNSPVGADWTSANPGDTGEMIQRMMDLGAATDCLDAAWWVLTSRGTDGQWPKGISYRGDTPLPFMHHLDLSLPYSILVDQTGRRFADEAGAYMEVGERMVARNRETGGKAVPAWVIFDARHRKCYPWGPFPPGVTPTEWLETGYMKKADTIAALSALCGIDAAGLAAEIARYNGFCRAGVDEDYGRGGRAFDQAHGDPTVTPNPSLGPIEQPPFFAVAMYPGDVGTAGGVVADEYARVLREDGSPIPGLYAIGNSTASVFGRCYPGAGASIGASFTFGFVAAHHALESPALDSILT